MGLESPMAELKAALLITLEALTKYGPAMTGLASVFVAVLVYRHSRRQRYDKWLEHFNSLHSSFWDESDMRTVRRWLASEEAYEVEAKPVLSARMRGRVTAAEYGVLENLDRFLNLMTRMVRLHPPDVGKLSDLRDILFFSYWLKEATDGRRLPELRWYAEEFYHDLVQLADRQFGVREHNLEVGCNPSGDPIGSAADTEEKGEGNPLPPGKQTT